MKSAFSDFHEGVNQLVVFLERSLAEQGLISLLNEPQRRGILAENEIALLDKLLQTSTNTKKYIYIVAIISIYGLLERLIDGLVERFVNGLGSISPSFSALPEGIRKNHLSMSLTLADAVLKDKFRQEISPDAIIANLNSCLSGASGYQLNGSAFAFHRGNVSIDKINEMLSGIGMQQHLRRILKIESFSNYLTALEWDATIAKTDEEVRKIFACIDELVDRRNEVSHGVVQVDNLESIELLRRRCDFVLEYGRALVETLEHETLKHSAATGVALGIGKPIAVFNSEIICFEAGFDISVGDRVFALTGDAHAPVRFGDVVSLEVDKVNLQEVKKNKNKKFGAKVMFCAKEGFEYFLLRSLR